jgi:hypothetical protein
MLRWLPVRPPWRRRIAVPRPVPAQPAAVGLAVRAYGERAGTGLPGPWPAALAAAARSRLTELPRALDQALARTDLGASRTHWWWPLAAVAQWLLSLAALGGLAWWAAGPLATAFGARPPWDPAVGPVPLAALVAAAALIAGALVRLLLVTLAAGTARLVHERALRRLRAGTFEVTRHHVVEPVREVLGRYARASAALSAAGSVSSDDTDTRDDPRRPAGAATADAGAGAGHR